MTSLRETAGFALLIAGCIGWLLPLIPGTPFLIAGIALLGVDHPKLRPWMARLRRWRDRFSGKAPRRL